MKKRAPHEAAAREAFEEAGLKGTVDAQAIGSYDYEKKLKDGAIVPCRVDVYPMRVTKQRRRWPEYEQRETRWFSPEEAAASVQEAELSALIASLEDRLGREAICPLVAAEPAQPPESTPPPEPASASA